MVQPAHASSGSCGCAARLAHRRREEDHRERPSVRAVSPCRKARVVEPTRICTAMTAASRKHQSFRLLHEDGPNSCHRRKDFARIHHPLSPGDAPTPAVLCLFLSTGRIPLFPDRAEAVLPTGGTAGNGGFGWHDSSSPGPTPTEQASDEKVMNAVQRLQDQLQQTLALTQRKSHKTGTERATSVSKGNAA